MVHLRVHQRRSTSSSLFDSSNLCGADESKEDSNVNAAKVDVKVEETTTDATTTQTRR
ncbi:hypothetical protein PPL_01903 [Heterostelium album PN500]|uniref:Uncharacterized protein n=1 Tax=Heterostelium pallidum (strain ATCC 26659 / Pp 5 / PN500) TaxID=670386 RepID=D3B0T6_HETP5|nr:hypothetical protein PPL_01903 [Heterostelium album PN500]EFA84910.1 hypothetical protein PPL_01903 [Heterostelium album PN500]|eukprot:XP_020437020.1 hypothetical protein PPL_01903 [Heterostelium album PN500]